MKSKKLLMFCLTSLAELTQHTLRQEIKLGETNMKVTEIGGVVDAVIANLDEASTEILALLDQLRLDIEAAQNLTPEVEATLAILAAKSRALADIVPNPEPQPEVPAEDPVVVEEPATELPVEEVPAEQPTEEVQPEVLNEEQPL